MGDMDFIARWIDQRRGRLRPLRQLLSEQPPRDAQDVDLVYEPADKPCGVERVYMMRGELQIGKMLYQVCHECQLGLIGKISIWESHRRQGLGTRAIQEARDRVPGFRWSTSWQYPISQTFWAQLSDVTGGGEYLDDGAVVPVGCPHMERAIRAG